MQDTFADKLAGFFKPVIEWRYFDRVTGAVSFLNPIALVPQLYGVIVADNIEAISVSMWCTFLLIQIAFTLVAVKSKNTGMFFSMLISFLISLSIIGVVFMKT